MTASVKAGYQLFGVLRPEHYKALEADIRRRGVQVPVEVDEAGCILDGHNRVEIAKRLGVSYKTIKRSFATEAEKREHVVMLNLARRHLETYEWGGGFKQLCESRGVRLGQGKRNDKQTSVKVTEVAKGCGVSPSTAQRRLRDHDAYEALPVAERRQVDNGEKSLAEAKRQTKKAKDKKKAAALPKGIYRVIYADPPWKYSSGGSGIEQYGPVHGHYDAISVEALCEMKIEERLADNAVLFLWVPAPMLEVAFEVIKAWGFNYKTSFIWDKVKHNFGHYSSVRHEALLVCTRGSCTPEVDKLFDSVQSIEHTAKHSEKPERFREIIDTLYPTGNRRELFGRKQVANWEVFGDQVDATTE